jgi:hypothetical protein
MWPSPTYLVACGLNRYSYYAVAESLANQMRALIVEKGINERYNTKTGQPLGDPGVGMTCAAWTMLVQSRYGVQSDYRTIVVPRGAKGRHLRLGKLDVSYPDNDMVELRTEFTRPFHVIFPEKVLTAEPTVLCDREPLESESVERDTVGIRFTAEPGRTYLVRLGRRS